MRESNIKTNLQVCAVILSVFASFIKATTLCGLVVFLTATELALAQQPKGQESVSYTDVRGNKVSFPLGATSFADVIVEYVVGVPRPIVESQQIDAALGPPDYDGNDRGGTFLTLGCGGTVTFGFSDNALVDVPGPDLYVFEVGANVEPTGLEISKDGRTWIKVGELSGGTTSVDISKTRVDSTGPFRFVRLTDLETACDDSVFPGADIDAVGAIGSVPATGEALTRALKQPKPSLDKGLVIYYPFNGNAHDKTGNGNHGQVHGATLTKDRAGRADRAYRLNGADSISSIHNVGVSGNSQRTIAAWIKWEALPDGNFGFIAGWGTNLFNGRFAIVTEWAKGAQANCNQGQVISIWLWGAPCIAELNSTVVPQLGKWYHVVGTYDGRTTKIYVNGKLNNKKVLVLGTGDSVLAIGAGFSGIIDDFRVYNRTLSDSEIHELYDYLVQ